MSAMMSVMRWPWLFLSSVFLGCVVNPVPEPPSAKPVIAGDVLGDICLVCDRENLIEGGAGAVENADSLWGANLDTTAAAVLAPVQSDGSFVLKLGVEPGNEVRLQARRDESRSEPIDKIFADGILQPVQHALADCFELALEIEHEDTKVGQSSSGTIRIQHTCSEPLILEAVELRATSADFVIAAPPIPAALQVGEAAVVKVDFRPAATGLREEVLLVRVSSASASAGDRRAVTLFGRGIP